jgi:hypothetical protein
VRLLDHLPLVLSVVAADSGFSWLQVRQGY